MLGRKTQAADPDPVQTLGGLLSEDSLRQHQRSNTFGRRLVEQVEVLLKDERVRAAINDPIVHGQTPLLAFTAALQRGDLTLGPLVFNTLRMLIRAGANPLTGEDPALIQEAVRGLANNDTVMLRWMLDQLRLAEQDGMVLLDDTGGNALHLLARQAPNFLGRLLRQGKLGTTDDLDPAWWSRTNTQGDTPRHLLWRGDSMAGFCAFNMEQHDGNSDEGREQARALWASLEAEHGRMPDLSVVGSEDRRLGDQILDSVRMGVPVNADQRPVFERVSRWRGALDEAVQLEADTAPARRNSAASGRL